MSVADEASTPGPAERSKIISLEELRAEAEQNPPDAAKIRASLRGFFQSSGLDATNEARDQLRRAVVTAAEARARFGELIVPSLDLFGFSSSKPFADLMQTLSQVQEAASRRLPPNWPPDAEWDQVVRVIQDSGIPLVWVPRAEIVEQVVGAATHPVRLEVLVNHTDEIVEDCRASLAEVAEPALAGQVSLAQAAVEAFAAGHHQAAQALAVVVTESAVANVILGNYEKVKKQVRVEDPGELTLVDLRLRAALAPIDVFYTSWFASSGTPAPEELSRHVSVHAADVSHYTTSNAHVAVMLVSSVLPALAEALDAIDRHDTRH